MKDIKKSTQGNCYCGQNGDQNKNMLYCVKCKRWLHEECVKCLDVPMLLGDRFYILICSVCNAGSECLARIELTWCEITHLVLYNLSVVHKKKYFDLDKSIVPFVLDNWERFRVFGPVATVKAEDRRSQILEVLRDDNRFKSGREIKKSKNIFGLRQRVPPDAPSVQPSAAKLQNDIVVWEFKVQERPYKILTTKKPEGKKETTKKVKAKTKLITQKQVKQSEVSKCHGGLPYNENGVQKVKHKTKHPTANSTATNLFNEESARVGLLDSLIPMPPDFVRENNPFYKSTESNAGKRANCTTSKSQPQSRKRRFNGELVESKAAQNDSNRLLDNVKMSSVGSRSCKDRDTLFEAKDYLSHNTQSAKKDGFCIIGKRVTSAGKIQYLFQRNRTKVESMVPEKKPPFTITFCCNCHNCKIINKLYM